MKSAVFGAGCLAAVITASAPAPAWSQNPAQERGLAAACFTCHGNEGRSVGGIPPSLAGRDKRELIRAMKDFTEGKRPSTIMHQHAKGYSDEQVELIADYFSRVKPGPAAAAPAAR